jgi:hypothetical protein
MKIANPAGRDILSGTHVTINLPASVLAQSPWTRLRDFCLQWTNPASLLFRHIHGVWLKFETSNSCPGIPAPDIFLTIKDHISTTSDTSWITQLALPLLSGTPTRSSHEHALTTCLTCATRPTRILQVGYQRDNVITLSMYPTSQEQLFACLHNQGWTGDVRYLKTLIDPLYMLAGQVCLSMKIQHSILTQISIECYFDAINATSWPSLLSHLVENELCMHEQQAALFQFPGYSIINLFYERILLRGLHHLTITDTIGHPIRTSIFIRCMHKPLSAIISHGKEGI